MKMFSSADDFFTPELRTLVSNKDTPLQDVLMLPYFSKSSRLGFPPVTKYLAQHSEEILKLAFCDDNSTLSAASYSVLLTGEPEILKPLITNGWLLTTAVDLLGSNETKDYLIGRLASVTLVCIGALDESILDQCTFIFNFLPHCNNPSAFNLLTSICDDRDDYTKLQEWLVKLHFFEYIFAEFDTIDFNYEFQKNITDNIDTTMYKDPVASKCLCLYSLLACCCQNKILRNGFLNDKLIEILLKKFKSEKFQPPDFIRTARWKTITAATQEEISSKLINILPEAIALLSEDFAKLRSYRVSALDFINKMLILQPKETYTLLMNSSMAQTLILLIMKFPNSSIFHSSFHEFVRNALTIPEFSFILANIYLPIIISHSSLYKPKEEKQKKITMEYYSDMTMNEEPGEKDVNNIEILFYPGTDKNPIRDSLNNIIAAKGIKQKHRKKKSLGRMIRHLFKKSENKVVEYYKDRPTTSAKPENNQKPKEPIPNSTNENDNDQSSDTANATANQNPTQNQSQNREEMKKKYHIDGDFDEDDENIQVNNENNSNSTNKNSKKYDNDDPRRVIVTEGDKNDKILINDSNGKMHISQNRVIQTCFFELFELFLEASTKSAVLKESIESINYSKEYINGPLKRYQTICKEHY